MYFIRFLDWHVIHIADKYIKSSMISFFLASRYEEAHEKKKKMEIEVSVWYDYKSQFRSYFAGYGERYELYTNTQAKCFNEKDPLLAHLLTRCPD